MQGFDAQSAEVWDKMWKEKMGEFMNRTKSKTGDNGVIVFDDSMSLYRCT